MELSGIEEACRLAQARWSNLQLTIKTSYCANSPCPWCGGTDRWVLFDNGYWFCNPGDGHCGRKGWLDDDQQKTWTAEERRLRRIEAEQVRARRERSQQSQRITALERMARCTDHEDYHLDACHDEEFWKWTEAQGLLPETVLKYKVGLCPRCPTDREHRPSYTFPIWRKDGPLWSIRHRLIGAENGDKYRPHRAGLGTQLANARMLPQFDEWVGIIEGTKKVRVIGQHDIPVVGILGKTQFETRWLKWFHPNAHIVIGLDPDAKDAAWKLGREIAETGKEVSVAAFPVKPDDMFVYGCTREDWMAYIHLARKIH